MISPKSVIITLPKGLQKSPVISPVRNIIKPTGNLNFTTSILATKSKVDAKNMQKIQHDCYGDIQGELMKTDMWLRGKKRRLDHLSWEEKLQRKKLKNRVAAQTSRDRKKAKLDELEETVRTLVEKNELIAEECDSLRAQNEALCAENQRLKEGDKSVNKTDSDRYCSMCMGRVGCVAPALGSAVSPINPLPQGGATQLAPSLTPSASAEILLKILTLYLLWRNSLPTSKVTAMSNDSKNLQKVFCEKLPLAWKLMLRDQVIRSPSRKIPLKNLMIQKKWWGRHQKMWKPVQSAVA
ncbi:X-box-binding protein 1 [Cotesia glomerata]|uniref:X-box-binding protein 1 n=1 Tax=Cotesia glomerata TaxID=32391 RepID=A0AAV7IXA0_COTGL|nr:X-box-binding protein 1 [Cotesia glomerata]KAH0560320.1 hypothetical protein KQX54_003507 [Cotesia glomerata]